MQTDIKDAGPFERILTIKLEEADLESAKNAAARKMSKSMKIKGFRPGKAPRSIVERMVGEATLRSEAIEEALPDLVGPAIEEAELEPATTPRVEEVRDAEGGGVDVDIKVTLWPLLDAVPDFTGRQVEIDSPAVKDEEIDEQIDRLRDQYAELEDVERPAADGDFVMINISASIDGVEIPEATAEDLLYEVASSSFIPGLDDLLGGSSTGDIREGPGTLPPGFGQDEPREAALKVLVKGVRAKKLPEVTDEWVSDVSEFDSVADLTDRIKTNLTVMKLDGADNAFRSKLIEDLGGELSLEVPEALIDAEMEAAFHNLAHTLEQQGLDFGNYLRIVGQTEQDFLEEMKGRSERTLKTRILLDSIVAIEGIELADGDLDEAIAAMATEVDQDAASLKEALETSGRVEVLTGDILRRKALDRIVASAVAVDDEGQHIDLRPPEVADDIEEADPSGDESVAEEV
ncbi:MAG: trigger factor [Acidimicrobiia bacterium]|nr:trigger factor [Acidimicrobiia bacterium]MDX2466280.1 trigger factor [Acidimicrobiia bacterium]